MGARAKGKECFDQVSLAPQKDQFWGAKGILGKVHLDLGFEGEEREVASRHMLGEGVPGIRAAKEKGVTLLRGQEGTVKEDQRSQART